MRARLLALCLAALVFGMPGQVRADAVDDAFARGNELARAGDWAAAIEEYEQARKLLPGRSALLSYNLGTAYAHVGETGLATFHLRRAVQRDAEPSDEIVEAARRNLGILQRRAELDAASAGAQISPPESWWDRVGVALAAQGMGWLTLVCGWMAVLLLVVRTLRTRAGKGAPAANALALVLGAIFLLGGSVHALAAWSDEGAPRAIALDTKLEVREGPGKHRKISFVLQGGSRVRVVDTSPGWSKIRLDGGLVGWVPERAVGRLDARTATTAAAAPKPGAE